MSAATAEYVCGKGALLGECPIWDDRSPGALLDRLPGAGAAPANARHTGET